MGFDYSKLRGSIRTVYQRQNDFATALGISNRSLSLKLNNKVPFTQPEIYRTAKLLKLDSDETVEYFFTPKV